MNYGWALDADIWRNVRDQFSGNHWSRTYLEDLYTQNVPSESGIYIITTALKMVIEAEPFGSYRNAIYVGQSKNLRARFSQHVKGYGDVTRAKQTFRRLEFWWTGVDRAELDTREQILIYALGPSANRVNVTRTEIVKARIGSPITI